MIPNLSQDCSYIILNFWPNLSLVVLIKVFLLKKSVYEKSYKMSDTYNRSFTIAVLKMQQRQGRSQRQEGQGAQVPPFCSTSTQHSLACPPPQFIILLVFHIYIYNSYYARAIVK